MKIFIDDGLQEKKGERVIIDELPAFTVRESWSEVQWNETYVVKFTATVGINTQCSKEDIPYARHQAIRHLVREVYGPVLKRLHDLDRLLYEQGRFQDPVREELHQIMGELER